MKLSTQQLAALREYRRPVSAFTDMLTTLRDLAGVGIKVFIAWQFLPKAYVVAYAALSLAVLVSAAFDLWDWKRLRPVLTLEKLNEILEDEL